MLNKWLHRMRFQSWVLTVKNKYKTIPIFVPHWGCPCECLFCDQKKITGVREEMTPERATEIIKTGILHKRQGEHLEIGFFGGSFTGISAKKQEALLELAYAAVQTGDVDGIRLSTRPDYINDAVLDRLQRFGVTTVELGAQSMNDDVLNYSRRGHTAEQTRVAARAIVNCGIGLGLQMMVGLPGDTAEITMQTAEEFCKLKPNCVRIYPTLVIRGTALDKLYQKGQYTPLSVEEAVARCGFLYQYFTEQNVDVIRMGLLQMKEEDISAGPYHSAFGELVQSAVFCEKLSQAISDKTNKKIFVHVHPRYVSIANGQKKANVHHLMVKHQLSDFKIIPDEMVPWGDFLVDE